MLSEYLSRPLLGRGPLLNSSGNPHGMQPNMSNMFFTRHGVMLATHKSCSSQGAKRAPLAQQTTSLRMHGLSRASDTTDPNSLLHDRVLRFGQRAPAQKTACHAFSQKQKHVER